MSGVGAGAPTPITVELSLHCAQLTQLIEKSAFVTSLRNGSSYIEPGSPAEQRIVSGAAILVENGRDPAVTQGQRSARVWRQAPPAKAVNPDLLILETKAKKELPGDDFAQLESRT